MREGQHCRIAGARAGREVREGQQCRTASARVGGRRGGDSTAGSPHQGISNSNTCKTMHIEEVLRL